MLDSDGILAVLPMGAGKTAAALTAIERLRRSGDLRRCIVLAPPRVAATVWHAEAAMWEHLTDLKVVPVAGPVEKRERLLTGDGHVFVVSVNNIRWLFDWLRDNRKNRHISPEWYFDLLVIDEVSRLRDPKGSWSKEARRNAVRFRRVWGLTGTLRPNGWIDVWAPVEIVSGSTSKFGRSFFKWRAAHFAQTDYQGYKWEVRDDTSLRFIEREVNYWSLRLDEADLPETAGLRTIDHAFEPPEYMMVPYRQMQKELLARLETISKDSTVVQVAAANLAVATIKLSQITSGFLYEGGAATGTPRTVHKIASERRFAFDEVLRKIDYANAVVAYNFKETLQLLKTRYGAVDVREDGAVERWNAGEIKMLAIHPASAAHGLNLQHGGHHLIWYEGTWSAELYAQAIKRLDRPGQTQTVYVHRLIARGTVDELQVLRVEGKIADQDAAIRALGVV